MRILLNLTLSGSFMALLLLFLRYVLLRRMPCTVYYYAWLLVLLRFLLPLPGMIPTGETAQSPTAARPPTRAEEPAAYRPVRLPSPGLPQTAAIPPDETPDIHTEQAAGKRPVEAGKNYVNLKSQELWLCIWAVGTTLSFAIYLASYMLFTRQVRRSLSPATTEDRRVYRSLPGRKPALCRCAAFQTPLMLGLLHPLITLPERDYDEELLRNILRHELMHYQRRDTLYKWFGVAVLSSQWFNPLSLLIRRELNRACELSCDAWLLRDMDTSERRSYGRTLLTMAAGALPAGVVATTFSTEKRNLKERLEQIMDDKKNGARVFAAVLTLALLFGFCAAAGPARAESASGGVETVSSVDGFLAAIGSDRVIELAPGVYDLSAASDYGGESANPFYVWNRSYDGYELEIRSVQNLTIRGAGKGSSSIAAVPRYANVLRFSGCENVSVEALTAGHTEEPGFCTGGVLEFEDCEQTDVSACGLYGCGILGVRAMNCNDLTVSDSEIYECSYGAVSLDHCRNVRVENCDIHDHGSGEGEALSLFDAAYSEDFVVYRNRIHDNRAQFLLAEDYTRRILFLSNDVTGNAFGAAAFRFHQYGATVDGCRFEGNDVRAWYQSGGIYAGDIDGNLLEGALFLEMSPRDIDPDSASPLASVGEATEVPKGGSVTVGNVDDFLAAIGPDRTIILDGALFDLSAASNYGGIGTSYYYWSGNYDGPQLVIHDANGLTIRARHSESGATTLSAVPRYADVLAFRDCENLVLDGFTAGHTKEPGVCSGGVLSFQNCHQVRLEKMRLYGCGILGIQTSQCSSFDILRTEIYECSQGAGMFFQTDGIRFSDCGIRDVPSPALIFRECGDKLWNQTPLSGLDGQYDLNPDGTLVLLSAEQPDFIGFGFPDGEAEVIPLNPEDREYAFIKEVQRNIVAREWEALANRVHYPVSFLLPAMDHSTNRVLVDSREEFLNLDLDTVFDPDYRQYVANASTAEVYPIWGYTALDGAVCYGYFEDAPSEAAKVTVFNICAAHDTGELLSLDNVSGEPFNTVPPIPFEEETPMLDFARVVQKEIGDWNWSALASKLQFPLRIYTADGGYMISGSEDFLALVTMGSTDNPLTPEFCEMVKNAELDSFGQCLFGNTFAAHRLAFACVSDTLKSMDDLKITCISVAQPLYRYQYAQTVPPTPMPMEEGLRVMFYTTEIETDFTIYPPDETELHVEIPPEIAGAEVMWSSDNPAVFRVEKTGADTARVSCADNGSLPQTCKLTVSCGGLTKELTVYCRE